MNNILEFIHLHKEIRRNADLLNTVDHKFLTDEVRLFLRNNKLDFSEWAKATTNQDVWDWFCDQMEFVWGDRSKDFTETSSVINILMIQKNLGNIVKLVDEDSGQDDNDTPPDVSLKIIKECIDIANYAMFIANKYRVRLSYENEGVPKS